MSRASRGRARRAGAGAVALALLVAPGGARAGGPASAAPPPGARTSGPAPVSRTTGHSAYEREAIARALAGLGLEREPDAEGKVLEAIEIVRLDVLEARDPVPEKVYVTAGGAPDQAVPVRRWLNALHTTSRDFVIRREMLLGPGDPYQKVVADETARNLRRLPQLSLVVIVPAKGSRPDLVKLLVVVKDTWSLRLSFDVQVTPGGVESLVIVPQETNLAGSHHTVSTTASYRPESWAFGAGYRIPRFGTSWIGAAAGLGITLNRRTGAPEGSSGTLALAQPLYSTRTPFAWGVDGSWTIGVVRRYVNAQVAAYDARATAARDGIPFTYKSDLVTAGLTGTRSFGWATKVDLSFGWQVSAARYATFDLSAFDPAAVAEFRSRNLPIGETRSYPFVGARTYTTSFLRTTDVNTLALQEDFRLGHDASVQVYPVLRAAGSTRDLVGVSAAAQYTVPLGDGLARAGVTSTTEATPDALSDASLSAGFRAVSPKTGLGRLVMDLSLMRRYRNYLNRQTYLGGEDRLRGYPSNLLQGKDVVLANFEFRTRPVELASCQVGLAFFYDIGDAFDGGDSPFVFRGWTPKHAVGGGVRALFPQLNRFVLRADVGVPLQRGPFPNQGVPTAVDPVGFTITFEQAFGPTQS